MINNIKPYSSSVGIYELIRFLPGNSSGKVISRVVLTPIHAKAFLNSLKDSVEKYEKKFGQITADSAHKNIGFQINSGDMDNKK
ncbi:DUF3467 domain-containing protein [Candidatus Latescibacterota bacterium]